MPFLPNIHNAIQSEVLIPTATNFARRRGILGIDFVTNTPFNFNDNHGVNGVNTIDSGEWDFLQISPFNQAGMTQTLAEIPGGIQDDRTAGSAPNLRHAADSDSRSCTSQRSNTDMDGISLSVHSSNYNIVYLNF